MSERDVGLEPENMVFSFLVFYLFLAFFFLYV